MTDADVTIEAARADTTVVKVTLPAGAPAPSAKAPIWVKLKVRTAEDFLGWAAAGGVVVVYQPGAPVNDQCGEKDYNCTVAHELGHKLNPQVQRTMRAQVLRRLQVVPAARTDEETLRRQP